MIQTYQFGQSKCEVRESKMAGKIQLLAIILAISISVGYARSAKKIIGGQLALMGEFPHQVSLQKEDGFHFCGGSIISSTLIVTAAHCIVDQNRNPKRYDIYVVVGTNDKEQHTSNNVFRVIRRIRHNYTPSDTHRNDIAILQLDRPIAFNNLVRPAKLPQSNVPAGTQVMSSGWGATTYDTWNRQSGDPPRFLKKLARTVVSQQECQKIMAGTAAIGPGHICVWSPNRAATCAGDSGGPLTHNGEVIGVTSFGILCAQDYPDVYTNIYYYLNWIRTVEWYMNNKLALPNYARDFVEA